MRIAVCSDEPYPVHDVLVATLEARGHDVVRFGSVRSGVEEAFVPATAEAAAAVAAGGCTMGVFCCWTGTGASIVANKASGVRAALCTDATTAAGARRWNDANVLCLSNRLLSQDLAREIVDAWFAAAPDARSAGAVRDLRALDIRPVG